jgi:hypothetical protein
LSVDDSNAGGGGFLSEYILTALELSTLSSEENCFISLNAITSTQSNKVIHLRALVGNQVLSILIDSGSSHTFLNSSMLTRIPSTAVTVPGMRVKVANGQTVVSTQVVRELEWWIQGCTFSVSPRVLESIAFDLILGMNWLELHSPMVCDWLQKRIQFDHHGI